MSSELFPLFRNIVSHVHEGMTFQFCLKQNSSKICLDLTILVFRKAFRTLGRDILWAITSLFEISCGWNDVAPWLIRKVIFQVDKNWFYGFFSLYFYHYFNLICPGGYRSCSRSLMTGVAYTVSPLFISDG